VFFKDQGHNKFDSKFKDNSWRSRTSGNLTLDPDPGSLLTFGGSKGLRGQVSGYKTFMVCVPLPPSTVV